MSVTKFQILLILLFGINTLSSQSDSIVSKIKFELDYRFRVEQDWDSRKSNGTYREDRSRMRYRLRTGASYSKSKYAFGFRIRTGDQRKQQDPQLTIGKGLKEFGTLPIGFEKLYFEYRHQDLKVWLGKNTYPFKKNNELFWSDNVFPEGISLFKEFKLKDSWLNNINLIAGHFVLSSNGQSFLEDAYFQGAQINFNFAQDKYEISSAFYSFRNIPNISDGAHSFDMPYSILHLRTKLKWANLSFDLDYYNNLQSYEDNVNLETAFKNQNTGYTLGIQYGNLNEAKKWMYKITYAYLERYSILDYMAQNDWARWDYSLSNSPDGRLSNYQGVELVVAYAISEKINLVSKYYMVEQLIPFGVDKESGQRVRFDIDVRL